MTGGYFRLVVRKGLAEDVMVKTEIKLHCIPEKMTSYCKVPKIETNVACLMAT